LGKLRIFISGIALLSLFWAATGCVKEERKANLGTPAPDFALTDLDGEKVNLSDYKGRVVLIDFWATWCPPCRDSIPFLENLYLKYKDNGFVVIGISFDENIEMVKRFKERYNMTYPILMGEEWIKNDYGVTGVPETFIIGRDGILKSKHIGFHESLAVKMDEEVRGLL
jgi:peroxiredoxin